MARGISTLNNELYLGRPVWNRLRYIKDPSTGKRVSRLNDPAQRIMVDVPELRIVDDELWAAVKARQAATTSKVEGTAEAAFWDRRRPPDMKFDTTGEEANNLR